MRLIDTHCHLNDRQAFPLPEVAVEEAQATGVDTLVVVGIDTESSRYAIELAERFEGVFAVVGWHPNNARSYQSSELVVIRELLGHPKVVALGEIGLDYYRDHASQAEQYSCLNEQLELAAELQVPIVFHCRSAYPDLLSVLEARPPQKYLFHCFAGDDEDAARAGNLGAYFGVDGPVTYKSSDALRSLLPNLDPARIVVETDSPWMAPVPYRGQRNRPAWVSLVNEGLAQSLGITTQDCAALTTANAQRFFGLA